MSGLWVVAAWFALSGVVFGLGWCYRKFWLPSHPNGPYGK